MSIPSGRSETEATGALCVGVDAGGSITRAASSLAGNYEGTANLGPANASRYGVPAAAATIVLAVREIARERTPAAIFVAAAGAGRAAVQGALLAALRAAFPATSRLCVEDDTRCALRAAIPKGPGVVLIAGTGSVAYAEDGETRVRVGGAGFLIGDEGSGFAIGMAAIRQLARSYDGRARADETVALVGRALGATDRDSLLVAVYDGALDVARIAALAPSIIAFAGKGNRASTKIVQAAAQDLGELVRFAVVQAGFADASPTIAFAGGLLRENSLLTFLLETRVTNETPGAAVVRVREEPVRVALRFAEAALA